MKYEDYYDEIYSKKHEKVVNNVKKPKSLLHFDYALGPKEAFKLVSNPENVEKHWFLPMLGFNLSIRRTYLEENKPGNVVKKRKNKDRPIRYASNRDAYIYTYYSYMFNKQYEEYLSDKSFYHSPIAYRSLEKNNIDFAHTVFNKIKEIGECTVICMDLTSFFDTLDHTILYQNTLKILGQTKFRPDQEKVLNSLTKYSFFDKDSVIRELGWTLQEFREIRSSILYKKGLTPDDSFFSFKQIRSNKDSNGEWIIKKNPNRDNKKMVGIPQGTPISALLSNIYMIDFDQEIFEYTASKKGYYVRYCDDVLVILPGQNCYRDIVTTINEILVRTAGNSLKINEGKTEAIQFYVAKEGLDYTNLLHPEKNFELQYLGFNFNGKRTVIRHSSIARYYRKLKSKLNTVKYRASKNEKKSTPYLRDIYQKYSHVSNKKTFISYVKLASDVMGEKKIMRQVKNHMKFIKKVASEKT